MKPIAPDDAAKQYKDLASQEKAADYARGRKQFLAGNEIGGDPQLERAVTATFAIGDVWEVLAAAKAGFILGPLDLTDDILTQIVDRVDAFCAKQIAHAVAAAREDGERAQHMEGLDRAIKKASPYSSKTAEEHLQKNIKDGIKITFSLIEVALETVVRQGGRSGREVSRSELGEMIKHPRFVRFVASIGYASAYLEIALLRKASKPGMRDANRFDLLPEELNPDCFELGMGDDGTPFLRIKPTVLAEMKAHYEKLLAGATDKTSQCPAGFVKGENASVIQEFIEWLVEIAVREYIPNKYPEAKKG